MKKVVIGAILTAAIMSQSPAAAEPGAWSSRLELSVADITHDGSSELLGNQGCKETGYSAKGKSKMGAAFEVIRGISSSGAIFGRVWIWTDAGHDYMIHEQECVSSGFMDSFDQRGDLNSWGQAFVVGAERTMPIGSSGRGRIVVGVGAGRGIVTTEYDLQFRDATDSRTDRSGRSVGSGLAILARVAGEYGRVGVGFSAWQVDASEIDLSVRSLGVGLYIRM
ncbi:MAG: hypothetical protein GF346_03475 [Candidatus Eisenbacteria bacterium]|nr:hypothetical protein [Candidatus Latescibacterota bacterium]MBD3301483.1 hypothetical protein [Candidatus Eisenbacteria bacterium]